MTTLFNAVNAGTEIPLAVNDIVNNQLIAGIQELQSLYDLIDSRATLMRLTGGIIEGYK